MLVRNRRLELPIWDGEDRLCVSYYQPHTRAVASEPERMHLTRTVIATAHNDIRSLSHILDIADEQFKILEDQGVPHAAYEWTFIPDHLVLGAHRTIHKNRGITYPMTDEKILSCYRNSFIPRKYVLGATVEVIKPDEIAFTDTPSYKKMLNTICKYRENGESAQIPYLSDIYMGQTVQGVPATTLGSVPSQRYIVDIEPRLGYFPAC